MVIAAIPPLPPSPPATPASSATAPASSGAATGGSFSSAITDAIQSVQNAQTNAAQQEALAASGQGNLADTMGAASEASLDTQVSTALLDKAVSSYNDIMQMSF